MARVILAEISFKGVDYYINEKKLEEAKKLRDLMYTNLSRAKATKEEIEEVREMWIEKFNALTKEQLEKKEKEKELKKNGGQ